MPDKVKKLIRARMAKTGENYQTALRHVRAQAPTARKAGAAGRVSMKKRRQHTVWRHYLEAWTTGGQLWCSMRGRAFRTGTGNVGHRHDFYRLKEMSDADLKIVEALVIAPAIEPLQALARGWIPHFHEVHRIKREYEAGGQRSAELEQLLDETINNLEEEMHASVEQTAVPLLAELREARAAFLDDDECAINFFRFVATQYMRTPGRARDLIESAREIPGFNAEAAWGLMRTIFATNLGYGFYVRRASRRLTFLDAAPETEFITGDQPIVNVRAIGLPEGQPPTEAELELYYPVTPTRALLLAFDAAEATTARTVLTRAETGAYNQMIVAASDEQIYAQTEAGLIAARVSPPV